FEKLVRKALDIHSASTDEHTPYIEWQYAKVISYDPGNHSIDIDVNKAAVQWLKKELESTGVRHRFIVAAEYDISSFVKILDVGL
ncbi:MAG: hypothetical protein ACRC3K_10205, partial [Plesiomonas sp.]